ncbi:hypothetical protein [Glutamicibacter uratoxydans]|uniref:hypothetical protein n=1 Tax=Glutamicibacter uratoxydans TaxID=43667 RepID=UPI003D6E1D2C
MATPHGMDTQSALLRRNARNAPMGLQKLLQHHHLRGTKMNDFTGNIGNIQHDDNTQYESEPMRLNYEIENSLDRIPQLNRLMRQINQAIQQHNLKAPKILTEEPILSPQQAAIRLRAFVPASTTANLEAAAQAVIAGEDPTEHMESYAVWFRSHDLTEQIVTIAREQFIDALNEHADNLTEQVRRTIFEPALRRLKTLLKNHPDKNWDLNTAIHNKDYAHAQAIDKNLEIAQQLDLAYKLRALFYNDKAFTNPAAILTTAGFKGNTDTSNLSWWTLTISNGHTAHLPTASEWQDLLNSKAHAEARAAEAKELAELDVNQEPVIVQNLMHEGRPMTR